MKLKNLRCFVHPNHLKKRCVAYISRRCVVCESLEAGHCGGWKNKVPKFLINKPIFKPIFYPKYLESTSGTLLNQSMALKNIKKPI
jgi:hypothetical protein